MNIPVGLARHAAKLELHKPAILFGVGVAGSVTSTVLACRATLKVDEVLAANENARAKVDEVLADETREYNEEDAKKDRVRILVNTGLDMARLYGPAVLVGAASIYCLTKSHNLLNDRITGLTAAYAALDQAYQAYRQRVVDKYGENAEREIRFPTEGIKEENPATGREHTVKVVTDVHGSPYARVFDKNNRNWQHTGPEYNLMFIRQQQNYLNDKLRIRGYVFLNDAYERLGLDLVPEGQVVGWVLDEDGDNHVDFGIFEGDSDSDTDLGIREYVRGREDSLWLDFNVDGSILKYVDKKNKERA